jgi:hypothetical protein
MREMGRVRGGDERERERERERVRLNDVTGEHVMVSPTTK